MKGRITTKEMTLCAMFTVLIAVGAFIKVPVPVVPFTLQFLFTMMAGLLLGGRLGAFCVALYAVLGLAGLPVFAEGGGFWYILKPSFGYIIGFAVGSYVTGKMTENSDNPGFGRILAANFVGLAIVYGFGMIYYYVICNFVINSPIGVWPLFLYCFILAVPGDICLCFLAAALTKQLKPVLSKAEILPKRCCN
ncbi:MAG: biotin transporter BioY [Lachnospiraceae bacterium]|nr:biotin transporter BioY [Lachnospiraceae bacterium]